MKVFHPALTALLVFVGFPVAFLLMATPVGSEGGQTPIEDWIVGWVVWAVAGYYLFGLGRLRERIEAAKTDE